MSCQYKDECPSYTGWCEGPKQDFSRCIPFLISAVEQAREELEQVRASPKILYECDRRACKRCSPECHLTLDSEHAVNFEMCGEFLIEGGGDPNGI